MKLSTYVHQFFDQYLPRIKGVSENTIKDYRITFTLLLPFAAQYYSIEIKSLRVDHLSQVVILAFLDYLEIQRGNIARTRNHRLAAIKSLSRMIRLMYPEKRDHVQRILDIPQKKTQKQLIGFLYQDEIIRIFEAVDLKKKQGFRDYTILHLLYDSGARASEITSLNLDYFDPQHKTMAILGKGNRYRLVKLWPRTVQLVRLYIIKYRTVPKPLYGNRLFINQRGEEFSRHGINRICKKYITIALPIERVETLNPVGSFRHSCAVDMLCSGYSIDEIRNRLGHRSLSGTMVYLHLDLSRPREMQKKMNEYTQSILSQDPKIEELIDWENKEKTLAWLDSL
jgi:site-specific recombinase XerD